MRLVKLAWVFDTFCLRAYDFFFYLRIIVFSELCITNVLSSSALFLEVYFLRFRIAFLMIVFQF